MLRNPPSGFFLASSSSRSIELKRRRWQYDFWWTFLDAQLRGEPDILPFDYHPGPRLPAIRRNSATSKVMLGWFKLRNEGRGYRDHVKSFRFLMMLSGRNGLWSGFIADAVVQPPDRRSQRNAPNMPLWPHSNATLSMPPEKSLTALRASQSSRSTCDPTSK